MELFGTYLQLGLEHITDLAGYDHILFIAALCVRYQPRDWRLLLWLVTAFTLGHSVSLALATLGYVPVNAALIEWLIPVTITLTCLGNIVRPTPPQGRVWLLYALVTVFGLIHGLGFSNYLRSLLGREADLFLPLLAFNVGLELGQLVVVAAVLAVGLLFVRRHRDWVLVLTGGALALAVSMVLTRWPF